MATYTARLKLRKPDYGDPVNVGTDVDDAMDIIDKYINVAPVAQGERPPNAPVGQLIYEETTGYILLKTTSASWIYIGKADGPKGKKAVVSTTSTSATFTTGEQGPFLSATFTAEAGRRYFIETLFRINYITGSTNGIGLTGRLRWATGASVTTAGTIIGNGWGANAPNFAVAEDHYKHGEFFPNISGQVTVALFIERTSGTQTWNLLASSTKKSWLMVRDYGV